MAIALTVVFLLFIIVAVIYVFLIMPRVSGRADMDLISSDYAHRGFHSMRNPENSLAAFRAAVENGFGIELDGFSVYDLGNEYAIDVGDFASKGRCTPFEGKKVFGKCLATVSGGRLAYIDEKMLKM